MYRMALFLAFLCYGGFLFSMPEYLYKVTSVQNWEKSIISIFSESESVSVSEPNKGIRTRTRTRTRTRFA